MDIFRKLVFFTGLMSVLTFGINVSKAAELNIIIEEAPDYDIVKSLTKELWRPIQILKLISTQ